ncbi:methyltransferase [Kitasatospora aureofaciens]|uniref:methyltransferase n=1 Tax=Kitasatospora aureofaciens TaxID=1894 RepID=UPI0033E30C68
MSTDKERIISTASNPVVRDFLRMADDSIVAILPYALSVAARLRIADECGGAGNDVETLAKRVNAEPDALQRILRALASCGFFTESGNGRFELTDLGDLLRSDSPNSMRATLSNVDSYHAWLRAIDTISTGKPSFSNSFDAAFGAKFFSHKEEDDHAGASFDMRMQERSSRLYSGLETLPVWESVNSLIDVGGGNGAVLASILHANQNLLGTLFDRGDVIRRSETYGPLAPVNDRSQLVAGDFFTELPKGADAHLFCSILHDWDDDKVIKILNNSRRALTRNGKVIICEMILPDLGEDHPARWSDLGMMIIGGRERTIGHYRRLARKANLRVSQIQQLPGSLFSVVELRREDHMSPSAA